MALRELKRPPYDPASTILQKRGVAHEAAYLDHLRAGGREVVELPSTHADLEAARLASLDAMQRGVGAIAQATFYDARWFGRADVLLRVERPSTLGAWSYEVADTKLSQHTKAGTILQLCLYSELLAQAQGCLPEHMHVIVPKRDFAPESYRVASYLAYHRLVCRQLAAAVDTDPHTATTYPTPCDHCDVCAWWQRCDTQRRRDDHLCLVANLGRNHERQLADWGISTLTALATAPEPFPEPSRGSRATFETLRHQARLQLASRSTETPRWEPLPIEPDRGLCRLPPPDPGDIFLDFEGDRFVEPDGIEYVTGWVTVHPDGTPRYEVLWALDETGERAAFDRLMTFIEERLRQHPGLHVYHYAPYEPTAIKRLMGKYAIHEDALDRLLRGETFVDLFAVVRQGLRVGTERYSIKNLEPLYGFRRELPLRDASTARFRVESALEVGDPGAIDAPARQELEAYNRDDCVSTLRLRDWLELQRAQLIAAGHSIPRPIAQSHEPSQELSAHQARLRELRQALLAGLPLATEERTPVQQATWLLAHLLEFFRREQKVVWWDYFRLAGLSDEERLDEPKALSGLQFIERFTDDHGGSEKCPVDRYSFPPQEVDTRGGEVRVDAETRMGTVEDVDVPKGFVDIKKAAATRDLHPTSVFLFTNIDAGALEDSVLRLAEWVLTHGIDAPGDHRAARDVLLRLAPRGLDRHGGSLCRPGEGLSAAACRLAGELDGGVLPIQGPPGAGKTYTGARMIVDLVRQGRKVGITALSHKVIRNLLDEAVAAASQLGVDLRSIQKLATAPAEDDGPIVETTDNAEVVAGLADGTYNVAAGTSWLWARADMAKAVDVLFIDEAGQMSLASALAVAQAANSLVLIGDPQQLEQPIQGTHPEGAGASALDHLLGGRQTVLPDRGLFLAETWRLHPAICAFTSEQFYEDRLEPHAGLDRQRLHGEPPFDGSGLRYLPVSHRGNQSSSPEEARAVADLVRRLTAGTTEWTDVHGVRSCLTLADVLVVAPFNAQVSLIAQQLPGGARVGTVDKFQGQEAPVVIYSLTSSTPDDAPRGMEFLYSLHRLNVATSRARCLCIVVASPALLEPECRTPRQIELANALCRYVELAGSAPADGESSTEGDPETHVPGRPDADLDAPPATPGVVVDMPIEAASEAESGGVSNALALPAGKDQAVVARNTASTEPAPELRVPTMRLIRNAGTDRVLDELRAKLVDQGSLSLASSGFSLFAFAELESQLAKLAKARLVLPATDATTLGLLGGEADRAARNRLEARSLAARCRSWVDAKADLKQATTSIPQSALITSAADTTLTGAITGSCPFTTDGLGLTPGNLFGLVQSAEGPDERSLLASWFIELWNRLPASGDAKRRLLGELARLAEHRAPAEIYFLTLFHLFKDSSSDLDEERIVKSATGVRNTAVWRKLYRFQRDGVIGALDKLDRFGGCILADSVGLGKTFEALAIIKYYELRNDRVLVLVPKRLRDNWSLYKTNDRRNVLASDRFNYDILNHTDLSRDSGLSGDIDLAFVNWGNYDLVVIDESHNFRNKKTPRQGFETRYDRLMRQIVKEGVKTRVLMLSATPVNNRLADLKNQISFATEANDAALADQGIPSIDATTRLAQKQFNRWLQLPEAERRPARLLDMLGFDYFTLLDLLTIARSRKHVERYYGTSETGRFPERLRPINIKPDVDRAGEFRSIREINDEIRRLTLAAYAPLRYVLPSRADEYDRRYSQTVKEGKGSFRQVDREESLINLLRVNALKRMESAVSSFALTVERQLADVETMLARIDGHVPAIEELDIETLDIDDPDFESLLVGRKVKVLLQDVDRVRWRQDLAEDRQRLSALLAAARQVEAARDAKLAALREVIEAKQRQPLNPGNRKLIVFTAFAETASYLYEALAPWARASLGLESALVTGTGGNRTTLPSLRKDLGSILTAFAPRAKERPADLAAEGELDLLIATDCISEGQNLQDCDTLVNYDIHWNPVRIIQRFGRIDRLGSTNARIQLINFWPNMELEEYINLERRVTGKMVLLDISATGEENVIDHQTAGQMNDLEYRRKQLLRLQDAVIDLEDLSSGVSIADLTLNELRVDLAGFRREHGGMLEGLPLGSYAVATARPAENGEPAIPPGALFCLRAATPAAAKAADPSYPLAPHYVVHVGDDGAVLVPHTQVKQVLDHWKRLCLGQSQPDRDACARFDQATRSGGDMRRPRELLAAAVGALAGKHQERAAASLFAPGGTHALAGEFAGVNDFEVVSFLVVLPGATA